MLMDSLCWIAYANPNESNCAHSNQKKSKTSNITRAKPPGLRLSRPSWGVETKTRWFHGFISWFHQPIDFNNVPFGAVGDLQTSRDFLTTTTSKSWLKVLLFVYLRGFFGD